MQTIDRPARAFEHPALVVVFALSLASWLAATWVAHVREGWDSASYFVTVMPLSIVLGALGGGVFVRASWRWPLAFVAGQFAGLVLLSHGNLSLWPFSLAIQFILALPCWGAAALAAFWRKRAARSTR